MRYVIPTIQHTGTKLLYGMFPEGFTHYSFYEEPESPNALHVGHITENSVEAIKRLDCQMIIPLRHPYLVAESWRRRNKPLSELFDNFMILVDELAPLDPLYLPIDAANRQDYLNKINKRLDLRLNTNWNVVNSKKSTYNLTHKDLSPGPIENRLVSEIEEFLKPFYPE